MYDTKLSLSKQLNISVFDRNLWWKNVYKKLDENLKNCGPQEVGDLKNFALIYISKVTYISLIMEHLPLISTLCLGHVASMISR